MKHHFLKSYPVVVSVPIQFGWSGGVGLYHGAVGLIQKLPFRVYVGVKECEHEHAIQEWKVFSPKENSWKDLPLDKLGLHEEWSRRLSLFLQNHFQSAQYFTIGVFVEYDWHDTNAFSVGLFLALLVFFGKVDASTLDAELSHSTKEQKNSPIFKGLVKDAWEMVMTFSPDGYLGSSGSAVVGALVKSKYPIIYVLEKRVGKVKTQILSRFSHNLEHVTDVQRYEYSFARVEDMFEGTMIPFPLEFVLTATEQPKGGTLTGLYNRFQEYVTEQKKVPLCDVLSDNNVTYYCNEEVNDEIHHMSGVLHMYSEQLIRSFIERCKGKNTPQLCNHLRQFHTLNHLFCFDELPQETAQPLKAIFEQRAQEQGVVLHEYFIQERMVTGNTKLLFVSDPGVLQRIIKKIPTLECAVEYSSWSNGVETQGARVEQNTFEGHLHSAFTGCTHKITSSEEVQFLPPSVADHYSHSYDILVDMEKEKLFIGGVKLTSDQMLSQRYTCQVLKNLLVHKGRIATRHLPASSYRESKNEFEKKVLEPLRVSFLALTGKVFPISLVVRNGEFEVCCSLQGLSLGIFEKIS